VLRLAEQQGAPAVRVFGSVARREAGQDSDLDVLVDPKAEATMLDAIGLMQDLEDLLGRPVHVVSEASLHRDVRSRVLAGAASQ
jgi:uncharacterized protein